MITAHAIRRAIAINAHPAGKAGMRKIESQYGYPNRVFPVTRTAHYPTPNRVGLVADQTIVNERYSTPTGAITVSVIHAHGNGTINCVNCL